MVKNHSFIPPVTEISNYREIRNKIDDIADYLYPHRDQLENFSLFTGKAGAALFYFYYHLLTGKQKHYEMGYDLLNESIDMINSSDQAIPSLCNGLSGVAWCIDLLHAEGLLPENASDVFGDAVYQQLTAMCLKFMDRGNYDFLHGAIGIMLYLNDKGFDISELTNKLLTLADESNIIRWISIHPEEENVPCYNMSWAHGNISVLGVLLKAFKATGNLLYKEKIEKLTAFVLSTRFKDASKKSYFPNYSTPSKNVDEMTESRLGWCYGDLGIGYILLEVAETTGNEELKQTAFSILDKCMQRKTREETMLRDACLCHGSTGVAHVFNNLWLKTDNEQFRETAAFWFNASLQYSTHADGAVGYKAQKTTGLKSELSLLDGIAGIGLTFISAIAPIQPRWDKFLMLS
jgi:lantibiotic modifying enzyme